MTAADRRRSGRNVAYVFLDFGESGSEPSAFVLRGPLVQAMLEGDPGFPNHGRHSPVLENGREAWHLLRLGSRSEARSEGAVSSSPPL